MKQQPKGLCSTQNPTDLPFSDDLPAEEISEPKTNDVLVKLFKKTGKYAPIKPAGFHTHPV